MNEAPNLPDEDEWSRNQYNPTDVSNPITTLMEIMQDKEGVFQKIIALGDYSSIYAVISGQRTPTEQQIEDIAGATGIDASFWRNRFGIYHEWLEFKAKQFLVKVRRVQNESTDDTLDLIMGESNDWLLNDNHPILNAVMKHIKVEDYTTDALICLLTTTNWPKQKGEPLEARKDFYDKCVTVIDKRKHNTKGLFGGLEE